jgi:hypothetical protein
MLLTVEKGLSGAASVARIAREMLEQRAREVGTSGRPYSPPRPERADGGPHIAGVSVEPETDIAAPGPGERGPEPDLVEPGGPQAPPAAVAEPPPPQPSVPAAEPDYLEERPVVAAEVAEAGAEDGAGAQVHVDPPWRATAA